MNPRTREEFSFISRKYALRTTKFLELIFMKQDIANPDVSEFYRLTTADTSRIKPGSIRNVHRGKYTLADLI